MLLKVRLFCFKFDEIPEILTFRFKFKAKLKFLVVEIQLFEVAKLKFWNFWRNFRFTNGFKSNVLRKDQLAIFLTKYVQSNPNSKIDAKRRSGVSAIYESQNKRNAVRISVRIDSKKNLLRLCQFWICAILSLRFSSTEFVDFWRFIIGK